MPIISHVVERHRESVAEGANDESSWRDAVSDTISVLNHLTKKDDVKFKPNVLVKICRLLQDVASRRYDNYKCNTLGPAEIDNRLHLLALECLMLVVGLLRDKTPLEVRGIFTNIAKIGGPAGKEYRIVFGYLLNALRYAIPDWYAENESILFGKDSPDGMNLVLMRVYSHSKFSDRQIMEKVSVCGLYRPTG